MEKFGKSQPVTRLEDGRFLTGQGRYVDDIAPEGALVAHVLRAPAAHGIITELDVDEARAAPGVRLVLTADDLAASGITEAMAFNTVKNQDGTPAAAPRRPILAEDRVRFVGEPVAMIVADTLAEARDAAEMIVFDYDDLPAHMDIGPGGEPLHEEALQRLLERLVRRGRRREAIERYRRFEARLHAERGLGPTPETRAVLDA